ncbi:MAG: VCBS repeat-containing protein, partial [Verrucomicrobiae bacterium]|nr:VCBS repeat-containing protein [Verrucomicrobiae bacterium]
KNGPCALYLQVVDYKFMNIAKTAGVAADETSDGKAGATAVDINQDGWMDIYLCRYDAPNLLFINNGDASFTERGAEYGLDIKDASVHAGFADYDLDGDLDCYLVTNILRFSINPRGRADYLLRNNGDGTFSDVSTEAGIWGTTQGHTAIWFDSNNDGWPDLYVANDFETPDRFYMNQKDGTFIDVVDEQLPHVTYFSMGADSGDLNNDGLVDYFVADMRDRTRAEYMSGMEEMGRGLWEMERVTELVPQYMWNALHLNSGTNHYKEMAFMAGMEATGWTWATRMADFDCDGFLDMFFTNGMIRNFVDADLVDRQKVVSSLEGRAAVWKNAPMRNEPNVAYHNLGDLSFEDVSEKWGLNHVGVSFGCATADMDGDGDPDLVYSNYEAPPTIMRNDFTRGNRLAIQLEGKAPNRRAIGAQITLESQSGIQTRQLFTERGIVSSEPAVAYFGLGKDAQADNITIRWPGGGVSTLENIPANNLITVPHPEGDEPVKPVERPEPLFEDVAKKSGLNYEAELVRIDELSTQRLQPRRLNGQGPDLAYGDVNGDGLSDIFVTGSTDQSGMLYFGQKDGKFKVAPNQPWESAAEADDLGASFVDINGDDALDLFIATGGVSAKPGDAILNDRLYLNDGKGNFKEAGKGIIPEDGTANRAIAVADIDGDGDNDVFTGGRYVPGHWPDTPRSFLYENRKGKLVDVSDKRARGLSDIGMVTDAEFADLNRDGRPDLIL